MPTRNLAIMFTDIKGFTARVSQAKRDDLKQLLSLHERLLAPVIDHFEGHIVKTIGDAFLVWFDSPTEAVLCGVAIQEVLRQHNAFNPEDQRIEVRVAINAGDVELIDGDVMGETVNLAARLEGIAEAGEVSFTEAVYLSMNRREAPSTEIGERTFAGIPYPVRVYKVIQDPHSDLARRVAKGVRVTERGPLLRGLHEPPKPASRNKAWIQLAAVAVAGIGMAALGIWLYRNRGPAVDQQQQNVTGPAVAPLPPDTAPRPLEPKPTQAGDRLRGNVLLDRTRRQMNDLLKSQGGTVAFEWLKKQMEQNAELSPLAADIPRLDAIATTEAIVQGSLKSDAVDAALTGLLTRYPQSVEVPLTAARQLEGKAFPYFPLKLYETAVARGANARDIHLFEFCIACFAHYWPGQIEIAHRILEQHFDERALAWAVRALDREESGVVLDNAWRILRRKSDFRTNDPFYAAVYRATRGYRSEAEADQDLRTFQDITAPERQRYVLAVHRWVLQPLEKKGIQSYGYSRRDLATRNCEELERLWNQAQK